MKNLLKLKAEKRLENHHKEYKNKHGESFLDNCEYPDIDHLLHMSNYANPYENLKDEIKAILIGYYKINNDHEFYDLMKNYMFKLVQDGYQKTSNEKQFIIRNGINAIVEAISYDLFINEGLKKILNK